MSNTLEAFGSAIDLSASRILNFPSVIFLCGGPINPRTGAEPSLRGLFHRHMEQHHPGLFKRVVLAEDANKWSKTAKHYDDLFDLENDLAYLSAVILLFVESAGSIAELGAFCNVEPLRKKLVAVLEHGYQGKESFIQDGPVASMKKKDPHSVLFYPWLGPPDNQGVRHLDDAEAKETIAQLAERVRQDALELPKEEKFDLVDPGHALLLVADFTKLGSIIKLEEIKSFLNGVGMSHVVQRLTRYLFLLEQLKIIGKTMYGNKTYYVGAETPKEFVRYGITGRHRTNDRLRLKSYLLEVLGPLDPDRTRAYDAYLKRVKGDRE